MFSSSALHLLLSLRKQIGYILLGLLTLGFQQISALETQSVWKWQSQPIPELGFDLDTAQVIRVTSLASEGEGTLREALAQKGPRLIVFEVGGVIDLHMKSIKVTEPECFVAAQTAPSPGITLIRGTLAIASSRSAFQHLAVRPGDAGQPKKSGWSPDAISTTGSPENVWIDHCSATWACDENLSASTFKSPDNTFTRRIFIRDCLIAEGLHEASHPKGPHSKGSLIFEGSKEIAIVRCLYASNVERNPVFKLNTSGVMVNCVIANPGERAIHASSPSAGSPPAARLSIVGNLVLFGEHSKRSARAIFEGTADAFFKDNEGYDWFGQPLELLRSPFPTALSPPVWPEGLDSRTPAAALWHVSRFVGAHPARRSPIDSRIVQSVLNGSAKIINSQEEVGGYPKSPETHRALNVPNQGRREWLLEFSKQAEGGL